MKPTLAFFAIAVLLLLNNSCSKSSSSDNRSPIDSPSQLQPDTSSLKKTMMYYSMTTGNPAPTDSQRYSYQYDDQRRLTLAAHFSSSIQSADSSFYKYFSGYYTLSTAVTNSGIQVTHGEVTFYGEPGKTPDSVLAKNYVSSYSNGVNSTTKTIYRKDGNGNDTLELHYNFPEGGDSTSWYVRHWYTGSVEDSLYQSNPVVSFSYRYSGGNLVTSKYYSNGVLRSTYNSTYSTTPNKGFYDGVSAAAPLLTTYQDIEAPGSSNSSHLENYTYSFDTAGRVQTQQIAYDISPYVDFRVYTYY